MGADHEIVPSTGVWIETPLIYSSHISDRLGCSAYLKLEVRMHLTAELCETHLINSNRFEILIRIEPPAVAVLQVPRHLTPTARAQSKVWSCFACFHRISRKCWPRCRCRRAETWSQMHRLSSCRCSQGDSGHASKARCKCGFGWSDLHRCIEGHVPGCRGRP